MVAKPIVAFVLALVCLFAAACSTVSSQEANRQVPATTDDQPDGSAQVAIVGSSSGAESTAEPTGLDQEPTVGSNAGVNSTSTNERGSRNVGSESAAQEDPAETSEPETSEPAVTPGPVEDPEPTTIATTAPLATAAPFAGVPTLTPGPDPEPIFTAPAPTGSVPSDDIVIRGPDIDESEPATISENGALACASAESAIEFLDLGDANRMAAALQEAGQYAGQAAEPEIAFMAADLAAAGSDEEASIAAIIATLSACVIHGYQV